MPLIEHAEEFTPGTAGLVKFTRPVLPVAGWISFWWVAVRKLSLQAQRAHRNLVSHRQITKPKNYMLDVCRMLCAMHNMYIRPSFECTFQGHKGPYGSVGHGRLVQVCLWGTVTSVQVGLWGTVTTEDPALQADLPYSEETLQCSLGLRSMQLCEAKHRMSKILMLSNTA